MGALALLVAGPGGALAAEGGHSHDDQHGVGNIRCSAEGGDLNNDAVGTGMVGVGQGAGPVVSGNTGQLASCNSFLNDNLNDVDVTVAPTTPPVDNPPPASNNAPVANNDAGYGVSPGGTLSVSASRGVLRNDTDADGDTLMATLVTRTANGTVALNGDGSFTYSPNPGFRGSDSFTYTATDGRATSNPATVTIGVIDR